MEKKKLEALNSDIKNKGYVDREHLLEFLRLIPDNNADNVAREVRDWLQSLHEDSELANVSFPQGDIDAIIADLGSYGRVQPGTIARLNEPTNRDLKPR